MRVPSISACMAVLVQLPPPFQLRQRPPPRLPCRSYFPAASLITEPARHCLQRAYLCRRQTLILTLTGALLPPYPTQGRIACTSTHALLALFTSQAQPLAATCLSTPAPVSLVTA